MLPHHLSATRLTCIQPFHSSVCCRFSSEATLHLVVDVQPATMTSTKKMNANLQLACSGVASLYLPALPEEDCADHFSMWQLNTAGIAHVMLHEHRLLPGTVSSMP